MELRTKSTQIRSLIKQDAISNCVVAFSINPEDIITGLEHLTPDLQRRISAMQQLQEHGWNIGLRFDPVIYADDYRSMYSTMFEQVFSQLDCDKLHSVSLGSFRLPKNFYDRVKNLYPKEPLFASPLENSKGEIRYKEPVREEIMNFCRDKILNYTNEKILFPCN